MPTPDERLRTMRLAELGPAIASERRTLEAWDDTWNTPPHTPEYKEALEYQLAGHEQELAQLNQAEPEAQAAPSDVDAALERARAAVERLGAGAGPARDELDQAADRSADQQYRLLTESAQARERGDAEAAAVAAVAYEAAISESEPARDALTRYDFDADPYDPAVAAGQALDQDRQEEYAGYLAEQGLTPGQDYGAEMAIE